MYFRITYIILFFVFVFTHFSYAGYPGDCTYVRLKAYSVTNGMNGRPTWGVDASGIITYGAVEYVPSGMTLYYADVESYYKENGVWILQNQAYGMLYQSLGPYDGTVQPQVANLPCPLCQLERQNKVAECGSEENIAFWSDVTCTGECKCDVNNVDPPPCDLANAFFDSDACQYICNGCEKTAEEIAAECPTGLYWFDNVKCIAKCKDCSTLLQSCIDKCGVNGMLRQTCTQTGSEITSVCQCLAPEDIDPPDDPIVPPLPLDPTVPDAPDPDLPDPQTDPGLDPDGTNDNALLGNIEDNTLTTANNIASLGKMLDRELNELTAGQTDTNNLLGNTNENLGNITGLLEDIKAGPGDEESTLGDKYLKQVEDNTRQTKEFLKNDDGFTQSDIDSIVAGQESALESTWNAKNDAIQSDMVATVEALDPVPENSLDFITVPLISLLPVEQMCIDLDLSYKNKEIIIPCDISLPIKQILSYFVYVVTMLGISLMIFRQLRPKQ